MRFVDANTFIYAFLEPKRKLSEKERKIKKAAQLILKRIDAGEETATSVIQVSETINVLSAVATVSLANSFLDRVLSLRNLKVLDASKDLYLLANELSKRAGVGINDCLAYALMRSRNIKEIYSFDKDFDKLVGIKRIKR